MKNLLLENVHIFQISFSQVGSVILDLSFRNH